MLRRSSLPFARLQTLKTLKTLQIPRGSFHQALWPSAFAVPALACPLPAHSPLLLGHSSLPFARLQTLKTLKTLQIPRRGSFHQALWPSTFAVPALACPLPAHNPLLLGRSILPFASLQTLKTLKTLKTLRGSFHQALWPSAFAVPALQPFACCLPAFKPLKLQTPPNPSRQLPPSPLTVSLCCSRVCRPFARLQTLKTLKTVQIPRGSCHQALWLSAFAVPGLQPAFCLHIALCY